MANIQDPVEIAVGDSDQELLDQYVVKRDEAAFARLVERHGRTIWSICRRVLQDQHDAEDAFQAAFIVLSRKASSIRKGEAVGSWVYRVAYRIALKSHKTLQRRRDREKAIDEIACEKSPSREAMLREMQLILDAEVDRLVEKLRAPFVLCCLEGMSKPEAARELGWPVDTVKGRLAQARKLLQTRLAQRGITLSAVLTAIALAQNTASAAAPAVLAVSVGQGASLSPSALALAESFVSGIGAFKVKGMLAAFLLMTLMAAATGLAAFHLHSNAQLPEVPKKAIVSNFPETFLAPPIPVMKRHDEQVLAVAFSPDGKRLAVAGARQTLPGQFMIWDVEARRELVRKRDLPGIRGIAFAPDGKTVACGAFGGAITLRDAGTGKERIVLNGHRFGVNAVAYSAGSDLLASAGLDNLVKLWDIQQSVEKKSFVGHTDMVFCVAFFKHGKAIVSGSKDKTAKIWDIDSGKVIFDLKCPTGVEAVAVSPNDKIVATGCWDGTIKLWNAETGKEEALLQCGEGIILSVAFSHDGALLASSSYDGSTRIWDVKTRETIKRLEGHPAATWSVAFAPDSKILATGSTDTTAKLWNVETGKEIATLATAEIKPVRAVAYSPDGKWLAIGGHDKYVQLRDARSGDVRLVLAGHARVVTCIAISPDGATVASGSADETIKLWDLATGKEKRTLAGHAGGVLAVAFAKDGKLASAGADKLVKWWNLADGNEPTTLKGHDSVVGALAFAPDGATLASGGGDHAIRIWSLGKDAAPRILEGHTASIRALAFASDGVLASAAEDGTVKLWEPGADKASQTLSGHAGGALALAFTPSGHTLVSGGADKNAIVWDPKTGKRRTTLRGHKASVTAVAIHPKGDHLITGSVDSVTLLRWRAAASDPGPPNTVGQAPPGDGLVGDNGKGVALPDAKAKVYTEIHLPLKGWPDNFPGLKLGGAHAEKWMRFEPAGLRITIPPGFSGSDAHVALNTGVVLKGDFEATVNYEILKLPGPEDAGPESGVTLSAWRTKSDIVITGATRRVTQKGGPQFAGWATWFEKPGVPSDHKGKITPTQAKAGRLRLARTGGKLSYYASESRDADFILLNEISIGEKDLDNLRLLGFTGSERASLDARFWDLRIRVGTRPGDPPAAPAAVALEIEAAPAPAGSRVWLATAAVVVWVFAMLLGLAFFVRWRRSKADVPPSSLADDKPADAAASVSFSCSCGKPLKVRAVLVGKKVKCPGCGKPVLIPDNPSVP